jgi:hypothetical protein
MTTKPNNNDNLDYANNYFRIPDDIDVYKLGLNDITVDEENIDFHFRGERLQVHLPTNNGLDDFDWLVNSIEQKLMSINVPYDDIRRISKFFAGIEEEVTNKLLKIRRCLAYIE